MHNLLHAAVIASGWIAGVAFIFNFATCFVMPWSKECRHKIHGETAESSYEEARPLCMYHTGIAWATVAAVSVHIILALVYVGV